MNKQTISILALSILFSANAFAEYIIKIPVEANGVKFISVSNESESENQAPEGPFDFSAFNGAGVFDWTQAGGDFQSESFQSTLYRKVLLRGWGYHSVWLAGDKSDLGNNYSKIVIGTQSGTFDCIKSGGYSVMYTDYNDGNGTIQETVFHCETSGYNHSGIDLGQEFSVSFQ